MSVFIQVGISANTDSSDNSTLKEKGLAGFELTEIHMSLPPKGWD